MILVTIKMTALPAKRKELLQTIQALIQSIRRVKGCTNCSACQDVKDKNTFYLVEKWKTQSDLDNHLRSNLFDVLLGTKNLMSNPWGIEFNTVSSLKGIEAVKRARGTTSEP